MAKKNDLASQVMAALMEYKDVTYEKFKEIAQEVAKEGRKKLKQTSPQGDGTNKGHYADGWTVTAVKSGTDKFSFVVHNKKKPGLAHLLEFGHQLRQGGRAKAFPHIKKVEEWCIEEYERRVAAIK